MLNDHLPSPVYLDYNATTPCEERVLEKMLPWFSRRFGNAASRQHIFGWEAAEAVEDARRQVAALLGADPSEIIFTSGATESLNLAIKGVLGAYRKKGAHLITCATEHKAVLDTCAYVRGQGAEISILPVDSEGRADLSLLEKAIRPDTLALVFMTANNETGVIHPVEEMGRFARAKGILFLTDAVQAVGKIPLDLRQLPIDLLALSAHKIYGPKGVGALYVRRRNPRVALEAQQQGGGHEKGWRSGTLNVPGIVGLGEACQLAAEKMEADAGRLSLLRNRLETALLEMGGVRVNGHPRRRLPHVTNLSVAGINGKLLLADIARQLAIAAGSACSSASPEPSHVLMAMGLSREQAAASFRFSLGRFTTEDEIDFAVDLLREKISQQRAFRQGFD